MAADWKTITVHNEPMKVYMDAPATQGPHPTILVIMGLGGVEGSTQTVVQKLAAHGYAAAAPDLYHWQHDDIDERIAKLPAGDPQIRMLRYEKMGKLLDDQVEKDVNATLGFLWASQSTIMPSGIIGFCLGGRVAYMIAGRSSHFSASVPYYPHNVYVPWGQGPTPLEQTSKISAPMLAFFGADDQNPSPDNMRTYDAELTKHKKTHEFVQYTGVGHGFLSFAEDGSRRAEVSKEAWPRTLKFFDEHLKAKKN